MPPRKRRLDLDERLMRAAARMIPGTLAGRVESAGQVREQDTRGAVVAASGAHTHDGSGADSTVIGGTAEANPGAAVASGAASLAAGDYASATGSASVAVGAGDGAGLGASAPGDNCVAVGYDSLAGVSGGNAGCTVVGDEATGTGDQCVAIGDNAHVTGDFSVAIGGGAESGNVDSVALGNGTVTGADKQVRIAGRHLELDEVATAPGNGPANSARLYARDNGSGKTQLVVIFGSGAVQVLATEP